MIMSRKLYSGAHILGFFCMYFVFLQDKNGTIEGDELTGFLKDLMEHEGKEVLFVRLVILVLFCFVLFLVCVVFILQSNMLHLPW